MLHPLHPGPSQLHLPSHRTVGVEAAEAAQRPDGEDASVGRVADGAAFVEHACDVVL